MELTPHLFQPLVSCAIAGAGFILLDTGVEFSLRRFLRRRVAAGRGSFGHGMLVGWCRRTGAEGLPYEGEGKG